MFEATLKLVLTLETREPSAWLPKRLGPLFRRLADTAPPCAEIGEVEDLIWALWIDHPDADLAQRMEAAIAATATRRLAAAETILDDLLVRAPEWAEAWNKRATVRFIAERDSDSVADIHETLLREPRHFGALGGFGQICLRAGHPDAALLAFEAALRINPHLTGLTEIADELRVRRPRTVH